MFENGFNKKEKIQFIESHSNVIWNKIEANNDGTFGKTKIKAYIKQLQENNEFSEGSYEETIKKSYTLIEAEKQLKKEIKVETSDLIESTKMKIEQLTDEEAHLILERKWIHPIMKAINELPQEIIIFLTKRIRSLKDKYDTTFSEVNEEIIHTQKTLTSMIDELESNEFTDKALFELKSLLEGE